MKADLGRQAPLALAARAAFQQPVLREDGVERLHEPGADVNGVIGCVAHLHASLVHHPLAQRGEVNFAGARLAIDDAQPRRFHRLTGR